MSDRSGGFGLDDLARQLAQSLPRNLRTLGDDLERNFKALLQSGLERMELVTREEFDIQSAVLERTREKLEAIDFRLAELERGIAPAGRAYDAAPATVSPMAPADNQGPAARDRSEGPGADSSAASGAPSS